MIYLSKSALLILLLASLSFVGIAQDRKIDIYEPGQRAQSFFVELGGPGFISANYDFRFQHTRNGWGGKAGLGYFSIDNEDYLTLPVQVNYLLGKNGHYFEMGAGASYIRNSYDRYDYQYDEQGWYTEYYRGRDVDNQVLGSLTFGYRKQPVDGGFNFRAGLSPILYEGDFIPYLPYISFGYSF
ncbi:hypothetical protein GCM10011386_12620 [Parapedobacter defluvii]|uniref:Outer membrane protein beta-barrel domain-containing protein n=1 Tax=Parapedobacter defluvii TaxID=2045106 RepID=A0ABQ1LGZ0_9SPHI|nr:hypothetical protein [Parapedobacter defluvii]GGC22139.1 hypothetical protein GCM10011386_12620 [Parapedobacter defluvii]